MTSTTAGTAPKDRTAPGRLLTLVLGRDRKQRLRLQRTLLAGGVCLVAAVVLLYAVHAGLAPAGPTFVLVAFLLAGLVLFYAVFRSGWNLRAADPNLTLPQVAFAVISMMVAYALCGPARGGFLPLLASAMVFAAFVLERRRMLLTCAATLALLLAVGLVMPWIDERYTREVELLHFLLAAASFPVITAVVGLSRQQWLAQRRQLAEALDRIQVLATRDELTGLINRRHLQELLQAEELRSRRSGRTLCLAMLDLDHFKDVNDRYGHAGGDEVLKAFAGIAARSARRSDYFARWGGEEFVWVLPETVRSDAECALQRLRQMLAASEVMQQDRELRITVSCGLTILQPDESWTTAIQRADEALYEAKTRGRDRVVWRATV
jgi:diguanylate cyclase (GGDEF)-like protein